MISPENASVQHMKLKNNVISEKNSNNSENLENSDFDREMYNLSSNILELLFTPFFSKKEFSSDPFTIDGVSCFYSVNYSTWKRLGKFKYEINIILMNGCYDSIIYRNDYVTNVDCSENIFHNEREKIIICLKSMLKKIFYVIKNNNNYYIVGNKLMDKREYEIRKNLNISMGIELNNCWICLEPCLISESLFCGHHIHTRCAEQLYTKSDKVFCCGLCRRRKHHLCFSSEETDDNSNNSTETEYESDGSSDADNEEYND